MGYIKEPSGIDFVVESKIWTEAEKEEMRLLIMQEKNKLATRRVNIFRNQRSKV